MTAGEVSLKVVADRLGQVDRWLSGLRAIPVDSLAAFKADPRNPAAAESFLRRGIEALLDVARHLLAKGYGLGALEYREVARRAADKGFLGDRELEVRFEQIAGFRNRLTHYYSDVTEEFFEILGQHSQDIERIAIALRRAAEELARRDRIGGRWDGRSQVAGRAD